MLYQNFIYNFKKMLGVTPETYLKNLSKLDKQFIFESFDDTRIQHELKHPNYR